MVGKTKNKGKQTHKKSERPLSPYAHLSKDDRLKMFAQMIVDRIIEEEERYQKELKKNPDAKRIYEKCDCPKCKQK